MASRRSVVSLVPQIQVVRTFFDAEQLKPWSTFRRKLRSLYEGRPHSVRHSARDLRRQVRKSSSTACAAINSPKSEGPPSWRRLRIPY